MWAPPRVFFFFVLIRTGVSLECEVCSGLGTSCNGGMQTCPPVRDTCVIVLIESTLDGMMVQTIVKGCESSVVCRSPHNHMNMGQGKFLRTSLVCCREKSCRKASPRLLPRKTKVNGKQCPGCYSWTDTCNTMLVNCTGAEKYCFDISSRTYAGGGIRDWTMMGCTTRSACNAINHGDRPSFEGMDTVVLRAHCEPDPSRGSHYSSELLLPTFLGLLLLKILS